MIDSLYDRQKPFGTSPKILAAVQSLSDLALGGMFSDFSFKVQVQFCPPTSFCHLPILQTFKLTDMEMANF